MEETSYFGGRLQEIREQADLTQQELADKAELSKATVAALERRAKEPKWETVLVLARALGVSCEAFTTRPKLKPKGPGRPPRKPKNKRS